MATWAPWAADSARLGRGLGLWHLAMRYLLFACCLVRRQAGNKTLPLTFCLVPVALALALWDPLPRDREMLMHCIVIDRKPPSSQPHIGAAGIPFDVIKTTECGQPKNVLGH